MGRAVFTIGFSPNSPPEKVEEVITTITETFTENGYEVSVDPPRIAVEDIEKEDFERIIRECLETLEIEGVVPINGHNIGEVFDAMGLERLDPDEVSPKWFLPKGFFC